MAIAKLPEGLKAMTRPELMFSWLNVTPEDKTQNWALIGETTELGIDYNPQTETQKLVVNDNATTIHSSNQKSSDVTLICCANDPVFKYISDCRDKIQCETERLDVDPFSKTEDGAYNAKLSKVLITVSSWGGENAECEYNIAYQGDPQEGTVTITGNKPTFTAKA